MAPLRGRGTSRATSRWAVAAPRHCCWPMAPPHLRAAALQARAPRLRTALPAQAARTRTWLPLSHPHAHTQLDATPSRGPPSLRDLLCVPSVSPGLGMGGPQLPLMCTRSGDLAELRTASPAGEGAREPGSQAQPMSVDKPRRAVRSRSFSVVPPGMQPALGTGSQSPQQQAQRGAAKPAEPVPHRAGPRTRQLQRQLERASEAAAATAGNEAAAGSSVQDQEVDLNDRASVTAAMDQVGPRATQAAAARARRPRGAGCWSLTPMACNALAQVLALLRQHAASSSSGSELGAQDSFAGDEHEEEEEAAGGGQGGAGSSRQGASSEVHVGGDEPERLGRSRQQVRAGS